MSELLPAGELDERSAPASIEGSEIELGADGANYAHYERRYDREPSGPEMR